MPRKTASGKKATERAKKPDLPRTDPIRSWSTLLGSNGSEAPGAGPGSSPFDTAARVASDSVGRGVELGYRVMDEYVRQGASVANAFSGPARGRAPSSDDLPRMTERMLQYTSDFTSLWFDAMRIMMGNAAAQPASGTAPGGTSAPASGPAAAAVSDRPATADRRPRWVLEVRSERPAEIIVALDDSSTAGLIVEPLRASVGKATIDDVAIRPPAEPGGPLRVRVHVPPGLAIGRYSGVVIDAATRQPRGRLTVTLGK